MPSSTPAPPLVGRADWIDAGRGIAIILVVLMHMNVLHGFWFYYADALEFRTYWRIVDAFLVLRMPLFFLMSGLLAATTLRRSWGVVARKRLLPLGWVFVLWIGLAAVYELCRSLVVPGAMPPHIPDVLLLLVWPRTTLWYIFALILFAMLIRVTRAVPAWAVVAVAAVVSACSPLLGEWEVAQNVTSAVVYFAIGARLPDLVRGVAERRSVLVGVLALGAAVGIDLLRRSTQIHEGLFVLASLAAVTAAVSLLPHVASARVLRPLRAVGRRTMPIFLMHPLAIIVVNDVFQQLRPGWPIRIAETPYLSIAFSLCAVAGIIGAAIAIHAIANRIGLRWLFAAPRWLVRERTPAA